MSSADFFGHPARKAMNKSSESSIVKGNAEGQQKSSANVRTYPRFWQTVLLFVRSDFSAVASSWLARGFLIASAVLTLLELKGMQAESKPASQMLETVFATYLLIWMHGVIFIAGSALIREADCLNDAILCRGVTRLEYIAGKLMARLLATLFIVGVILLPASFWAVRQDKLTRTKDGYVTSAAENTKIEAWEPKKVFAQVGGPIKDLTLKVGDSVRAGDVLATLDDRQIFQELEMERRNEENARNDVNNARRRIDDAKRAVAQAEDALVQAERGLIAKDLLSKAEQANRETDIRSRKRDLKNAESMLRTAENAIPPLERAVENAAARVSDVRRRLGYAVITAPISGYVIELSVQSAQYVGIGTQLLTLAPLDDYQVRVPVYQFDEFKRLKTGLPATIRVQHTEYKGTVERLSAMTQADRWGRDVNHAVVRFKGNGTLGLLGLDANVRLALPPKEAAPSRAAALMQTLTGQGTDDLESRSSSVTVGWMLVGFGKVLGCAFLLVTTTFTLLTLFRNTLVAILGTTGLWHISNILFDFVGLRDISYLEIVRNLDKVLAGIAKTSSEIAALCWLFGLAAAFGLISMTLFTQRDPPK